MSKQNRGGAPLGNHNRSDGLQWKLAIKRALARQSESEQNEALLKIATELLKCAMDSGNPNFQFAVKEIGLRLDGKPREHIEIGLDSTPDFMSIGVSQAYATLVSITKPGEVIEGEKEALTVIDEEDEQTKHH